MTSKKPSLSAALRDMTTRPATPTAMPEITIPESEASKRLSRQGMKVVSGHFDPAVSKQLKLLAIERNTTLQDLLAEAINDLFSKHQKSPIA